MRGCDAIAVLEVTEVTTSRVRGRSRVNAARDMVGRSEKSMLLFQANFLAFCYCFDFDRNFSEISATSVKISTNVGDTVSLVQTTNYSTVKNNP